MSICLIFFLPLLIQAQATLDDKVYLASANISSFEDKLEIGYRAFQLSGLELTPKLIDTAYKWLVSSPNEPLIWIISDNDEAISTALKDLPIHSRQFLSQDMDSVLGVVSRSGKNLYIFGEARFNFLPLSELIDYFDLNANLGKSPTGKDFVLVKDTIRTHPLSQLDSLINHSGKLPNFIVTSRPEYFRNKIDSINRVIWYRGLVVSNGEKLKNVSWQHSASLSTSGKFHLNQLRISPYKRGYHFSPDVMNFNEQNQPKIKVFRSETLDLNTGLQLHLDFNDDIINKANPTNKHVYASLDYASDPIHGIHGVFNGKGNYIDFGSTLSIGTNTLTISAWIKPYSIDSIRSLVGMGEVFSAKIHKGGLQFTTPDIMDYELDGPMILQNTWQHVAFVYMENKRVLFYHNGQLMGDFIASELTATTQSLVVGTNLWDEYYHGGMDNLYVWDRALSDEEVTLVYQSLEKVSTESTTNLWYWVLSITLMIVVAFILVLFSKGTLNTSLPISKNIPKKDSSTIKSGVYLFGGFKIFNKSGKELTLAFSPKKKELFVLVLLYTFRKQGISSKEMANILWEGHSFESAKNNRSTQVQRLRETLEDNTGIRIEYMNKVWCIEMDEEVHWDFLSYQQLTQAFNNASDKEGALIIDELTQVINEGILLPHMHYEWLDPIKNQISEELILLLTPLFTEQKFNLDNNTLIRLTNVIFSFDSLNELALNYKIHLLQSEGRHVLAKNAYKEYCHAFFQFYNQEYSIKFSEWELS